MAYVAPIHRPTSIRHAVRINLLSEREESLVLAKANRIEIWRQTEGYLSMFYSLVVHGTVSMLQKLQPKDSPTALLFVGTDRFQYFSLEWNPKTNRLETVDAFQDFSEKHLRDSQSQDKCMVDPSGQYMGMLLWEGVLSVLRLGSRKNQTKKLEILDQIRVTETFIKSSTFLHSDTGHPKIAFLYQSRSDSSDSKLATYRFTQDDKNIKAGKFDPARDREISMDIDDAGAAMLIPIERVEEEKRHNVRNTSSAKAHLGGLLVVGEVQLIYIDDVTRQKVETPLKTASIFVAWAKYDTIHYLLADDYGFLHLLTILTSGVVVTGLDITRIGKTSRASELVCLPNDLLFVASHYGDSQLYRCDLRGSPIQLELVQTMSNIGPILDFAIMDMGNREDDSQLANEYSSGQARIVTGSGVHKDGSLRSVRSGVGLEDIGILGDMREARGLFSLRSHGSAKLDTLVASFLTETRVFRFDPMGEIEEVEAFEGLSLATHTLLTTNLPDDRLLQVTSDAVSIIDTENGMATSTWTPPEGKRIVNASSNSSWVLLSVGGTSLVSLSVEKGLAVAAQQEVSETDQIACIHASPQLLGVGVVGFWASGTISIVDLATLNPHRGESLRRKDDSTSIPRDIILAQILPTHLSGPTLLVAMDDGHVVTFEVSKSDYALSGRKSVVLGTQHARFHLLPQADNTYNVFTTTEHPSLIYGAEGRIIYSAVTAKDATYVCTFDSEAFPEAIAVATESQIKISQIDTERRTHVTSLEMGETIRRIAYSANEKAFGLGCIKRELIQGEEVVSSSFKLVDEVVLAKMGEPFELEQSPAVEIVECVIRAELPDCYGKPAERFLVGTSFLADAEMGVENEELRGRILVLGVDSERNPYQITSHPLKGACRCLAVMDDMILAGLTKTVVLSKYEETSSTTGRLTRIASYRPSTYPIDIAVHGHMIAVADLMKSISLVEYVPAEGDKYAQLVERARHYQSAWATAVCHIEDESWLEADAQGNLMVLRRNVKGITLEDQRRLETTSEINLGEMVNKIRPIAVETTPNSMIIPKAFLATVEGAIYMFGIIAPHAQDLLMRFQSKLETMVQGPGKVSFRSFRAFRNPEREADGPYRFIDGELLERFLDIDEELQREICEGLGPSVEDMRDTVEELKRLH